MANTTSKFEEVAASFYRAAEQPSGEERRKYRRTPVTGQVIASLLRTDAPPISAVVRDLSRGGIGLSCTDPVRRGQQFIVVVNLGKGPLRFTCKCANCRLDEQRRYIIGAEFVGIERPAGATSDNSFSSSTDTEEPDPDGRRHVAEVAKRLERALHEISR